MLFNTPLDLTDIELCSVRFVLAENAFLITTLI